MKMTLQAIKKNNDTYFYPNCPKSQALSELLNRGQFVAKELPTLSRMGYELEIIGSKIKAEDIQ